MRLSNFRLPGAIAGLALLAGAATAPALTAQRGKNLPEAKVRSPL